MWRTGSDPEWQIAGRSIDLALDEELTALLGQTVMRPVAGDLMPGAELVRPCERIDGVCGSAIVGAGPDRVAPLRPVLDVQITLVDGGHDGSGFGCLEPDVATLTLTSATGAALDDVTPDDALTTLAYVGRTAAEVDAATVPTSVFGSDLREGLETTVYVGFAGERDLLDAFRQGTFCVAVEAMDAAGNRSERSAATCVDSLDREASSTTVVQGQGCSVAAPGSVPSSTSWLVAAVAALLVGRRRR